MDEYEESSDVEMVPIEEIDKIRTTSATELVVREIVLILSFNTVVNQCRYKKNIKYKLFCLYRMKCKHRTATIKNP